MTGIIKVTRTIRAGHPAVKKIEQQETFKGKVIAVRYYKNLETGETWKTIEIRSETYRRKDILMEIRKTIDVSLDDFLKHALDEGAYSKMNLVAQVLKAINFDNEDWKKLSKHKETIKKFLEESLAALNAA